MFAQISIRNDGSLLVELKFKPVLFDQIREAQLVDAKLSRKRETVQNGLIESFSIDDCDYVVGLKELILHEAHDNAFVMHPSGTKRYRDLQELYRWP
ncbi:NBS-LRR resistance-like protein [Gossypium australe]|uniref:NBS-LRR resistance-like protein n=1 Tax=Gossypium australe TaxID=47621 RepID=A0A5B6VBL5_9ROSI|nr:NBS-LRR resistance-like protein [Gossypium australe]